MSTPGIPGAGLESNKAMRFTSTVKPTLSTTLISIQNRHPGPEHPPPLPPPPNTIMNRFSRNRLGKSLYRPFSPKRAPWHRLQSRGRGRTKVMPTTLRQVVTYWFRVPRVHTYTLLFQLKLNYTKLQYCTLNTCRQG